VGETILDRISSPQDVKGLDAAQVAQLASEVRDTLVSTVSVTGGHLAPNLGVVELTIGLLRALDLPADRLIWDVGHQSYVHKLLTGRRERFATLRQYGGVCGFPKRSESPYDMFDTGHASNSISVALGLAQARDAQAGEHPEHVVAVIGDGSLTGGMAFEALNHAGHLGTRLIVVLNDNEMSISENVGALASYLARVRLDPRYIRLRDEVEGAVAKVPGIGAGLVAAGEAAKESFKQLVVPGMLFEELGWTYVGPINGHDVATVEDAIRRAKKVDGPVIVHVVTHKGHGYAPAEESPDLFHGIAPFDVATGKVPAHTGAPSFTEVFSEALVAEAERDERVCAITAAMASGTGLDLFRDTFPDRFYDVGIAEQHAVGFAAGLALGGRRPVVAIYSTFLQRAYDQVIMDVCLQNLPVVFALDRAGLVGEDGPTHHGVFDMTYLRAVPNLTLCTPADEAELVDMLHTGLAGEAPFAIRYPRGKAAGVALPREPSILEAGRAQVRRTGTDVALLAFGRMVGVAERASQLLMEAGVSASVVNMRWVKPLDLETVAWAAQRHDLVVTIEENTNLGGAGAAVLEALADMDMTPSVMHLGVPDCFVTHGAMERLLSDVRLTSDGVRDAVLGRLERVTEGEVERRGQTQSRHRAR
jgi:1-deoxy-D-xylulose-5-phosphate synthase